MVSRDYSREIGFNTAQRVIPLPYVIAIIAVIVAVGWYGFSTVRPKAHEAGKASATTEAPASAVAKNG